jgi:hypothetical protein
MIPEKHVTGLDPVMGAGFGKDHAQIHMS